MGFKALLFSVPLSSSLPLLPPSPPPVAPLKKGVSSGMTEGSSPMGMVDTLQSIVRDEGTRGLYRGLLPNFLKVIPAVSIGYVVYEQLKLLMGVDSVR